MSLSRCGENAQHRQPQQLLGSASFGMLLVVWTLWDRGGARLLLPREGEEKEKGRRATGNFDRFLVSAFDKLCQLPQVRRARSLSKSQAELPGAECSYRGSSWVVLLFLLRFLETKVNVSSSFQSSTRVLGTARSPEEVSRHQRLMRSTGQCLRPYSCTGIMVSEHGNAPAVKGGLVTPGSSRMAPAAPKSLAMAQAQRPHCC